MFSAQIFLVSRLNSTTSGSLIWSNSLKSKSTNSKWTTDLDFRTFLTADLCLWRRWSERSWSSLRLPDSAAWPASRPGKRAWCRRVSCPRPWSRSARSECPNVRAQWYSTCYTADHFSFFVKLHSQYLRNQDYICTCINYIYLLPNMYIIHWSIQHMWHIWH